EVRDSIMKLMDDMLQVKDIYNLVLACTHYPIVDDVFYELYPQINYINPAAQQAKAIDTYLRTNKLFNAQGAGNLEIMTSGDIEIYEKLVEKLSLTNVKQIATANLV